MTILFLFFPWLFLSLAESIFFDEVFQLDAPEGKAALYGLKVAIAQAPQPRYT